MKRLWLRECRIKKGLTQLSVAETIGVKYQAVTQYESGTKTPTVKNAKKIAALLDFDWTKFYEDEDEE